MKVYFSNRAYAAVLAETTEKIKTETGGLFLGTVRDGNWYIIETIDPGPKSIFEVAYFEYDQKYTQHLINKIANLYDQPLGLVGLWHRHPGSFDQFSTTDNGTNAKYAAMRDCGAISALVNIDPKFRLTVYHVAKSCHYMILPYEVGDHLIPPELLRLKTPERFMNIMDNILHPVAKTSRASVSLAQFMQSIKPALAGHQCAAPSAEDAACGDEVQDRLINAVFDDISFLADEIGIEVSLTLKDKFLILYQDTAGGIERMVFLYSLQQQAIILSYGQDCYQYHPGLLKEAHTAPASKLSDVFSKLFFL